MYRPRREVVVARGLKEQKAYFDNLREKDNMKKTIQEARAKMPRISLEFLVFLRMDLIRDTPN